MFMNRIKVAPEYDETYLEIDRPQPLADQKIESLIVDVMSGKIEKDISDTVYENFKNETSTWLLSSTLNKLKGLDTFSRIDIINGCTQFIDNIYMQGQVQVIRDDYKYHERLHRAIFVNPDCLISYVPLIIAMPFPRVGMPHPNMNDILDQALSKEVPVHIDGAWITCSKDLDFDFNHPAIKSVGISLSKGLGLGWNRIGLRWHRDSNPQDSISIMNDFSMNNRALAIIGLHFVRNLSVDYLWNMYYNSYDKVCADFNLEKTNAIHLALKNGHPVGVSPLIRYLNET